MWSAPRSASAAASSRRGPGGLSPLLHEIGETHLKALSANAAAHAAGLATHDVTVQGATDRDVPTSAYGRMMCSSSCETAFGSSTPAILSSVRALLERHACWEPLWRIDGLASGHDPGGTAPFCKVHEW